VKSVSADGRVTTVQMFRHGTNTLDQTLTTVAAANANGSYAWTQTNGSGTVVASATHTIDQNGLDSFVWSSPGNSGSITIDTATEASDLAAVRRVYDTILDRDMSAAEQQLWGKYALTGLLDLNQLASDLVSSSEFGQKYATLTNTGFIAQMYESALGRAASLSEFIGWL